MIYTVYLSKDHPGRDFLFFIIRLIIGFTIVGMGIALAETIFDEELLVLLFGGVGGLIAMLALFSLWEKLSLKMDSKKNIKNDSVIDDATKIFESINWDSVTLEHVKALVKNGLNVNARGNLVKHTPDGGIVRITGACPLDVVTDPNIAEYLIKQGANVNGTDSIFKVTPLHHASNIAVADVLLANGADINHRTPSGNTPLLTALRSHRFNVANYLVDHGADINVVGKDGKTPLHFEVSPEFTKKLLDLGADKNAKDINGLKPIDTIFNPNIAKLLK